METKHTPTPWAIDPTNPQFIVCKDHEAGPIIGEAWNYVNGATDDCAIANAAFIVLACNSHDALVEACKAMHDYWMMCAESAFKNGGAEWVIEAGASPQIHAAEDEPILAELAEKGANLLYKALKQAGEDA